MGSQDLVLGLTTGFAAGITMSFVLLKSCLQGNSKGSGRVNTTIKLDQDKVVDKVDMEDIAKDGMLKVCRCWKSKTFPLCDGSHVAHNKECNDNVGPALVFHEKQT